MTPASAKSYSRKPNGIGNKFDNSMVCGHCHCRSKLEKFASATFGEMAMAQSARANFASVVRAGESYHGKQGLDYTPGVSAESVGSQAIWLGSVTLPPKGGRTKAQDRKSVV